MHLYLLRHGIAKEAFEWDGDDATRPLTEEGETKTRAVLKALRKEHAVELDAIWTSPFLRAKQTAAIAAEVLKAPVVECPALAVGACVEAVASFMKKHPAPERLMLVGHEPSMGEMLGDLSGEGPQPMKKAGCAHLSGPFKPRAMKLHWHLRPKDLLED